MRASTNEDDPGYPSFVASTVGGYKLLAFLDGVEVNDVMTADEENGIVVRALVVNGELQLTPDQQEVLTETLQGSVEIRKVPKE